MYCKWQISVSYDVRNIFDNSVLTVIAYLENNKLLPVTDKEKKLKMTVLSYWSLKNF
jgi:hypothetical protein